MWDLFIGHAPEDRQFVEKLTEALRQKELNYGDIELNWGDSLSQSIENAFSNSKCGVMVLSQAFFSQLWPQRDLDYLAEITRDSDRWILPIWHDITAEYVEKYSPILAQLSGVSSENDSLKIASTIKKHVSPESAVYPISTSPLESRAQPGTLSTGDSSPQEKGIRIGLTAEELMPLIAAGADETEEEAPLTTITGQLATEAIQQEIARKTEDEPTDMMHVLYQQLVDNFSLSELRDLTWDLGIDYESLQGDSKNVKVREMLLFAQRRGYMPNFMQTLRQTRPDVEWAAVE